MSRRVAIAAIIVSVGSPASAEVVATALESGSSLVDATSYATSSFTDRPYNVLIATLVNAPFVPGVPATPTLTGHALTWVQVSTKVYAVIAVPTYRVTVFRCSTSTTATGTITFDLGGETQTLAAWQVVAISGTALTNNGGDAITNIGTAAVDATDLITVTLGAFGNTDNATMLVVGSDGNSGYTAEAGYTEVLDFGNTNVRTALMLLPSNDTTPSATAASALRNQGAIAFELIDGDTPDPKVLTSSSSNVNATSYATASVDPKDNVPLLLGVLSATATTPSAAATVTSSGVTWTQVATEPFDSIAASAARLTLFRGLGATPGAGAVTMDYSGVTQTSSAWFLLELEEACTSGLILQSDGDSTDDAGDTSTVLALAAFNHVSNPTFAILSNAATGAANSGTATFIEFEDFAVETERFVVLYSASNQTAIANTWSSAGRNAGIAVEICSDASIPPGGASGDVGTSGAILTFGGY